MRAWPTAPAPPRSDHSRRCCSGQALSGDESMVRINADLIRLGYIDPYDRLAEFYRIFEDQLERLENSDRLRLQRTSYGDESEWAEDRNRYGRLFKDILPQIFRYSCLVSLLTAVEITVVDFCDEIARKRSLNKKFQGRLLQLYKVRNYIVHRAGLLRTPEARRQLTTLIKDLPGISLSGWDQVEIAENVCAGWIFEARGWIEQLYDEMLMQSIGKP